MNDKHLVAVYGTLKSGRGNHGFLNGSKFVGKGLTQDKFYMESAHSGVPMVFREPALGPVAVEIYEVGDADLKGPLDSLESNGFVYNREVTTVVLDDGTMVDSWLYFGLSKWHNGSHDDPNHNGTYNYGYRETG